MCVCTTDTSQIAIHTYLGLARTIYIRCIHGIFGREITNYTVIYGVYRHMVLANPVCVPSDAYPVMGYAYPVMNSGQTCVCTI
jgi:hypothetical protein